MLSIPRKLKIGAMIDVQEWLKESLFSQLLDRFFYSSGCMLDTVPVKFAGSLVATGEGWGETY